MPIPDQELTQYREAHMFAETAYNHLEGHDFFRGMQLTLRHRISRQNCRKKCLDMDENNDLAKKKYSKSLSSPFLFLPNNLQSHRHQHIYILFFKTLSIISLRLVNIIITFQVMVAMVASSYSHPSQVNKGQHLTESEYFVDKTEIIDKP